MTCGSTALQKLQFTADDYTVKSRINNYVEDLQAACQEARPYLVKAGNWLVHFYADLQVLRPRCISAYKKMRALLRLNLPVADMRRPLVEAAPESGRSERSLPVLLRDMHNKKK